MCTIADYFEDLYLLYRVSLYFYTFVCKIIKLLLLCKFDDAIYRVVL